MVGMFIVLLLFLWTLYKGPISVPYLKPYILQALNYDENDYEVDIGDVNIEFVRSIQPLRVTADDISLKKKDETFSIRAPKLYMSFSFRALMKGIIAPSDVSLINPSAYVFATYGVEQESIEQSNKKKLQYYVELIKGFLENYNSQDKIYPESYVNNIKLIGGEMEFHEVDFGRKWIFSDINFEFSRNLINLEVNANALVNINDKIASAGFESVYHGSNDKLDMEVYFSDLILSDMMGMFNDTTEDNVLSVMSIEVPVNGKVDTVLNLNEILQHSDEVQNYIDGAIEKINFEIDGGHGFVTFESDEKYNYEIDEMQLAGEIDGGLDEIYINKAKFKMGGQNAEINIHVSGLQTYYLEHSMHDLALRFQAKVGSFPFKDLSRFWPRYIAESAWQWCKDGLIGGYAKKAEFTFDFGYDKKNDTWGLINLSGIGELEDVDLFYLEGMPLVNDVYGTAYFTGHNILINIDKGVSDGVIVTGGKVNLYDLDKEDNFISINLTGNSSVTNALKLIDNEPLNITSGMGIDADSIKGDVDVKLGLDFELREDLDAKDIKIMVDADLHNIELSDVIPSHNISAEKMKLKVDSKGWSLQGEGKYDDMPLAFAMKDDFNDKKYKTKCNISFKLDEDSKKILGIDWKILSSPNMEGYALINADVVVKEDNIIDVTATADLQHTKMDYAYLGFVKGVGEKAEAVAKIKIKKDKVTEVSEMSLVKPDFDIMSNIDMYASGRVKAININKISGPKSSARAKISLTDSDDAQIKIEVSGTSYDLSPLFDKIGDNSKKDVSGTAIQENEDDGLEKLNNTDVFITVNSLWTNDSTPIKNFAGSAKLRRGEGLHEVHLLGNYGIDKSIKLNLDYVPKEGKEHYLSIDSNNAGSTLKVLRLYDNMVGGTLKIEARRRADKRFIGHAMVRDFSIQDAPVVAKLLSVASFTGMLDLLKGDGLTFTHFSAPFEYQYKILQLNHAKAEGNVVGVTIKGTYSRASDDIALRGVIAPAYSLNRILGKIPVVGNLLSSKDGTIFAADYKIKGSSEKPNVDVNSLSILSPNSMKEWYNKNFGDGDDL